MSLKFFYDFGFECLQGNSKNIWIIKILLFTSYFPGPAHNWVWLQGKHPQVPRCRRPPVPAISCWGFAWGDYHIISWRIMYHSLPPHDCNHHTITSKEATIFPHDLLPVHQAALTGVFFVKLSRPKRRQATVVFSKNAVIYRFGKNMKISLN